MNNLLFRKGLADDKRRADLRQLLLTMKITVFLSLVFITCVHAEGVAQRVSLSLKKTKLVDAFTSISKQTKHRFLYEDDVIKDADLVSVDIKNASLNDALSEILDKNEYAYKIIAGTITISKKPLVNAPNFTDIQQSISGTVKDANGRALAGATVSVKGSSVSTSTNDQGQFTINATANSTLLIRFVGFSTKEVAINGQNNLSVVLQLNENELDMVDVVSTGYQNLNRKLFTGVATKINAADAERAGVPDVSRMLEGQVAGVSVQNVSGTFGAAPKIRVRGATSISGDNKPLWVVDGIILEDVVNVSNEQLSTGDPNTLIGSSVAGLNPDDIESFEILRDASATALYGARAMNGVVVVMTKKGKNTDGKANLSYTGNFTTFLKPTYGQFDIMNSADQMQVYLEMQDKGWLNHADVSRSANGGVFRKMYDRMYIYDPATDSYALRNDAPSRLGFLNRYANANTDWFDVLFRNSLMQEHSVSLNAGTAKSRFYASTSYLNDNGWTVGDGVKRFTGNLRGNFDLSDRLQVELLTQGSVRDQRSPGSVNREDNRVEGQVQRDFDINPFNYALNTSRALTAFDENGKREFFVRNFAPFNILHELDNNYINTSMIDLKVQAGLTYKIIKGLNYSFNGAYRFVKNDQEHRITEYSNAAMAYRAYDNQNVIDNNRFLYEDPSTPGALKKIVLPEGGFYNVRSNNLTNYYMRHNLEYNTTISNDHRIGGFLSTELRYIDKQNRNFDGVGYQYDRGGIPYIDFLYFKQAVEANSNYYGMGYDYERYLSYMANASYSYKKKYNVKATMRYDGSNLLGISPTARWLPTWNVAGLWNIDEEDFFQNQDIVSSAAIRATYGLTANSGAARNSTMILRNQTVRRTDDVDKEPSIYIDGLENSELTYEKQYEANVGFNVGFLNNRLNFIVDFYRRNAYDLIGEVRTSGIGGQGTKFANYADMTSKGIEFTMDAQIINQSVFKWSTNLNFGYHVGKITKLDNNATIFDLIKQTGGAYLNYPEAGLFSIVFDGLDPASGLPTFIDEKGNRNASTVYFQDNEVSHLKYEGQINPKLTGGFNNRFKYKNFSLSALVTFSAGNKVRLNPNFSAEYSDLSVMSNDFVRRWTKPGDELLTDIPSIADRFIVSNLGTTNYPYNAYNYSTARVADGGFARLKQVMFSYQLPSDLAKKFRASNASVSVVGNNLWLIYSDKRLNGQDPEFVNSGGVAMPLPRQFSLSLKLGF